MRIRWCLAVAAACFAAGCLAAVPTSGPVAELIKLQQKASDGVVFLDGPAFTRLVGGRSRPYSVVVFSNAYHLLDKPQLRLRELRAEFGHLARSYRADAGTRGKVFFVEIEFGKSKEVFSRLNTKSLPYLFYIAPGFNTKGDGILRIASEDVMQPVDYGVYPWTADHMASFVAAASSVKAARIVRPSLVTHWSFPFLVLAVLGVGAAVGLKLYYAPFMKNHAIWACAILAVYLFSVSGGMHNIIRGVPMQHIDRGTGQLVLFLKTAQSQLGAEGFIMGTLYTSAGLCVAALTHGAPLLPKSSQKYVSVVIILVGSLCYFKIRGLYFWKTGLNPVWYI